MLSLRSSNFGMTKNKKDSINSSSLIKIALNCEMNEKMYYICIVK